ncbi:TetR/AcrR family transcriptional regulator [Streptomyces sp. GbtcB6]|uniref:TetR/AcrR family transcriptional regulator n=1 Tax=Streptomyces sp. GbtcB6 TaxID=2824751 RepID=UPI001C311381|nr:TetR/AcrR family transcriptional regulator [Streptomyces sp. GbtcB6]
MGRTRGFDEGEMLAVIRDQFWSRGYEGTSTYDLMAATGLGKGSIYKAYGNKHELYLHTFDDYCKTLVAEARQALAPEAGGTPLERIGHYLMDITGQMSRQSPPDGCYLTKATVDQAAADGAVAKIARDAYENIAGAFESAVREAQSAGEVAADRDARGFGYLLLSVLRGVDCLSRTGVTTDILTATAQAALTSLRA